MTENNNSLFQEGSCQERGFATVSVKKPTACSCSYAAVSSVPLRPKAAGHRLQASGIGIQESGRKEPTADSRQPTVKE